MSNIIYILQDCFHAGRRFENGNHPQQTFQEWMDDNDIEDKVKNLFQPTISRSHSLELEKNYKHSFIDATEFVNKLQQNDMYEILDLLTDKWKKQKYTYIMEPNEQETPEKMLHGFRMGWIRPCNKE